MRPATTTRTGLVAVALMSLALAGCGGDEAETTSGEGTESPPVTVTADSELAALVPEGVTEDGVLVVATDASYAPNEFFDEDNETLIGMDIDLGTALGDVLDIEVRFENAPFDSIIPGLESGKYELGMSSFTINPERMEVVDMVSYFVAGTSWAVPTDNPDAVSPDDACGAKVAVQKATVQVDDVTARSEQCLADGETEITIDQYTLQTDATTAVVSGKDDAMLADSPVVAYAIKQTGGQLEVVGDTYDDAPYGIAVPQADPDFAQAVLGAVNSLIESGRYTQILDEWGVGDGAVETAELNPVP
ncbi:MAG TPA: ABC transporter substrate-binding protein [Jiangellales bacterium]|nr:ABC transporter substrate-binding protein [Jiangellales bacterium]